MSRGVAEALQSPGVLVESGGAVGTVSGPRLVQDDAHALPSLRLEAVDTAGHAKIGQRMEKQI